MSNLKLYFLQFKDGPFIFLISTTVGVFNSLSQQNTLRLQVKITGIGQYCPQYHLKFSLAATREMATTRLMKSVSLDHMTQL